MMSDSKFKRVVNILINYKKPLIFIIAPPLIALIPILIQTKASKCAFVVILMATFWLTETLPICITALFPIFFYPILGIMKSEEVCPLYFKDIVTLFFGGLVVANAIELTRLHERIALFVLIRFGSNPRLLMLGFMITTAFLSLWISNTATTAMMLPVVLAVVKQLNTQYRVFKRKRQENNIEMIEANEKGFKLDQIEKVEESEEWTQEERNLSTGFLLCCSYSASIGGMGSLVGTAPNVVLKGHFDKFYPDVHLNFLSFLLYALPVSVLMIFISWIWLSFKWLPKGNFLTRCCKKRNKIDSIENSNDIEDSNSLVVILKEKYAALGPMKWAEISVAIVFMILVLLWLSRDFHAAPGWDYFFLPKYVSDSTPAILAVFLLFLLPSENIFKGKPYNHLIQWKTLEKVFPWDVFLLLGGSLAMAEGFQVSGLSLWIGKQFSSFTGTSKEIILLVLQIVSAVATEFTSNVSIASIFIPLFDSLADKININPIYLLLPMTLSVSLAFMLPVASPTNAMIFASGQVRIIDMVKTGVVMNIIGIFVIFLASNTWLGLIFDTTIKSTITTTAPMILNSTITRQ